MNELEMCKAMAKLQGIDFEESDMLGVVFVGGDGYEVYDPINDLRLNCELRDHYGVCIDYPQLELSIFSTMHQARIIKIKLKSVDELRAGVVEIILRSTGLWKAT